jgi:hypothetical protein
VLFTAFGLFSVKPEVNIGNYFNGIGIQGIYLHQVHEFAL